MGQGSKTKSAATMDDVLDLIGELKAGNFSKQLNSTLDPKLKDLVDGLNDLTRILAAKTDQKAKDTSFIVESLGIGTWKWDLVTNSLEWDENMYRLYGANPDDFTGAYDAWESSLSSESKAEAVKEINTAIAGGKSFDTTFQVVQRNSGKVQDIRSRAFVIRDSDGKPLKMWGINIDRTRESELELELKMEQLKVVKNAKLATLGEMSAGVAHEVNNPLAIIMGKTTILLRKVSEHNFDLQSAIKELKTIESAGGRIAKIVKSLRTYSRNAEDDPFEETRVLEIINDTFELCRERFNKANIELQQDVDPSLSIRCRPAQISQVLMNLLQNSYDAVAGLNSKWINVTAQQENGIIQLRFMDSGPGIPEAVTEKMMHPFFTTKGVGKGTGLGLSISTGIIMTHGGVLAYDKSAPHTTFTISLPRAQNFQTSKAA